MFLGKCSIPTYQEQLPIKMFPTKVSASTKVPAVVYEDKMFHKVNMVLNIRKNHKAY